MGNQKGSRDFCHFTDHCKGPDQHSGFPLRKILWRGLTPADGNLELAGLDHAVTLIVN